MEPPPVGVDCPKEPNDPKADGGAPNPGWVVAPNSDEPNAPNIGCVIGEEPNEPNKDCAGCGAIGLANRPPPDWAGCGNGAAPATRTGVGVAAINLFTNSSGRSA